MEFKTGYYEERGNFHGLEIIFSSIILFILQLSFLYLQFHNNYIYLFFFCFWFWFENAKSRWKYPKQNLSDLYSKFLLHLPAFSQYYYDHSICPIHWVNEYIIYVSVTHYLLWRFPAFQCHCASPQVSKWKQVWSPFQAFLFHLV